MHPLSSLGYRSVKHAGIAKCSFNYLLRQKSVTTCTQRINNGAQVVYDTLVEHEVDTVFGYPGGAGLPLYDALARNPNIRLIQPVTEAGAISMADGYSWATSKPGMAFVTSGPGATNCLTGLSNALGDGTRVLVFTGQVATNVIGTDAFQEAKVVEAATPLTKGAVQILDGKQIRNTVKNAFEIMGHQKWGPCLIDVPKDLMSHENPQDNFQPIELNHMIESSITPADIIHMINNSSRPVILAGQGVMQGRAIYELREFAKFYNIPVTTTLMGLGVFDESSYQSLHMLGMHGSYYANMAIQNADLVLNFGSSFDDRIRGKTDEFARKAKIVHVDILPRNINKVVKTDKYINGNCLDVLRELNSMTGFDNMNSLPFQYKFNGWYGQINKWKKEAPFSYPNYEVLQDKRISTKLNMLYQSMYLFLTEHCPKSKVIPMLFGVDTKSKALANVLQGQHVLSELNKLIQLNHQNHFTIVADVGAHQMWAAQYIDYCYPKVKFRTSGGQGQMGYALAASMGIKVGLPHDTVICVVGDGGFSMTYNELITAINNKINIKVLIINNSGLRMVSMWQEKFYNNRIKGTITKNPPFEKICRAIGCKGIKVNAYDHLNGNLTRKLKKFLNYTGGPIVMNVITDPKEDVLPMVSPGKALDDMIIHLNPNQHFEGDAPC
jgi:acetolactate synthase-1/2/3 large subunit